MFYRSNSSSDSPVGPWSDPGPCSVTCGKGQKIRTREALKPLTEEEKAAFPTEDVSDCYMKPCFDGKDINILFVY